MDHKLIVFDWNGTILSDTVYAWEAGNKCLEFYGAKPISLQQYRETFTFPIIHFYKKNGLSIDDVLVRKEEGNAVFQAHYESLAAKARTRTGARDLLQWLHDRSVSCIILSNYQTDKIKAHLSRLNLDRFFQYVSAHDCSGTTILEQTTKAERLSNFMVKRGYKPDNTVIIGDSAEEPDIGRYLGLTSIGITDGTLTRARLLKAQPDYVVKKLADVKSILNKVLDID